MVGTRIKVDIPACTDSSEQLSVSITVRQQDHTGAGGFMDAAPIGAQGCSVLNAAAAIGSLLRGFLAGAAVINSYTQRV